MSESRFQINGLCKRFGPVHAVRGVTMAAGPGTVIGLVGRNAAGKTTLLRSLVGLLRPSAGTVTVLGRDSTRLRRAEKQRLGYLSEREIPFPWATPHDLIQVCAPLYPRWDRGLEREILESFQIAAKSRFSSLSLGQRRALGLLLALCPQPELLVLDEPAANLDAVVRRQFLQKLLRLIAGFGTTGFGTTVLFSSHILSDVERVADRIAVLHQGCLLLDRELDDLRDQVRRLRLVFDHEPPEQLSIPGEVCRRRRGRELLLTVDNFSEQLPARLQQQTGAQVDAQPLDLEEYFIDLVGDRGVS